jgi:hypothetical protein
MGVRPQLRCHGRFWARGSSSLGFGGSGLGAAVGLCSAFLGFASLPVVVTLGFFRPSVTGWEVGLGVGVLALTSRPHWTTWLQTSPRSISFAVGSARLSFGAAGLLSAVTRLWIGARFASAALASLHFTQPR